MAKDKKTREDERQRRRDEQAANVQAKLDKRGARKKRRRPGACVCRREREPRERARESERERELIGKEG